MFKTTIIYAGLLFIFTSVAAIASSDCSNLKGCEKKSCEIEGQLMIANEKGNERKVDGLGIALESVNKYCTDSGLREELVEKIEEAQKDITEYESDLKEADEYGKTDKVQKYQEKIKRKQHKIMHLKDELKSLD